MHRRSLIAGLAAGALCAPAVLARPQTAGEPALFETYLVPHGAGHGLAADLTPGQRLELRAATDRHFDPRSIAVVLPDGPGLGFLPGPPTRSLSALMRRGQAAYARVSGAGNSGRRIGLEIVLGEG